MNHYLNMQLCLLMMTVSFFSCFGGMSNIFIKEYSYGTGYEVELTLLLRTPLEQGSGAFLDQNGNEYYSLKMVIYPTSGIGAISEPRTIRIEATRSPGEKAEVLSDIKINQIDKNWCELNGFIVKLVNGLLLYRYYSLDANVKFDMTNTNLKLNVSFKDDNLDDHKLYVEWYNSFGLQLQKFLSLYDVKLDFAPIKVPYTNTKKSVSQIKAPTQKTPVPAQSNAMLLQKNTDLAFLNNFEPVDPHAYHKQQVDPIIEYVSVRSSERPVLLDICKELSSLYLEVLLVGRETKELSKERTFKEANARKLNAKLQECASRLGVMRNELPKAQVWNSGEKTREAATAITQFMDVITHDIQYTSRQTLQQAGIKNEKEVVRPNYGK